MASLYQEQPFAIRKLQNLSHVLWSTQLPLVFKISSLQRNTSAQVRVCHQLKVKVDWQLQGKKKKSYMKMFKCKRPNSCSGKSKILVKFIKAEKWEKEFWNNIINNESKGRKRKKKKKKPRGKNGHRPFIETYNPWNSRRHLKNVLLQLMYACRERVH